MFEQYIAIGIILSLIYYEVVQLSPGGLITPGYLALFIDQPMRLLATFLVLLLTFIVVKLLRNYLPIYGKRQFATCVVVAIFIKTMFLKIPLGDELYTLNAIGIIVPGLIANDMLKQGVRKTLISMSAVTLVMFLVLQLLNGRVL